MVTLLEKVWERIRQEHPELPQVVIVTGSGMTAGQSKWGHFRAEGWKVKEESDRFGELFMAGETLAKGAHQVLQTMLHEGAHTLARVRDIQDTSRQGRWHNKGFVKLAEEMGLEYRESKADSKIGYSAVTLTSETIERYADLMSELNAQIRLVVNLPVWLGGDSDPEGGERIGGGQKPVNPNPSSGYVKMTCECEDPNVIRASKKVADKMSVRCDDCEQLFRSED